MTLIEKLSSDYEKVIGDSILNIGHNKALKEKLSRPNLKIAFLGGSVTFGYSQQGNVKSCYPEFFLEKLTAAYNINCTSLNLGTSGTASIIGSMFAETKLSDFMPDIVILEYAINEAMSPKGISYFESLLRKVLALKSKPFVIVVSVTSKENYSCQNYMTEIATYYNQGAVGLAELIPRLIQDGQILWEDYSDDEGHPTNSGQEFIADCLIGFINKSMLHKDSDIRVPVTPLYCDLYERLRIYQKDKIDFNSTAFFINNQSFSFFSETIEHIQNADSGLSHSFSFTVKCRFLCIVFRQHWSNSYGVAEIYVDGKLNCELSGYSIFGWNNPVLKIILDEKESRLHRVEVRMLRTDRKKLFSIGDFGFVE